MTGLLDWIMAQRGAGAPLAAKANDVAMRALGPHGRRAAAPVAGLFDLFSPGADVRDAQAASAAATEAFRHGNWGQGLLESAYVPAALAGVVLPGSIGGVRRGADELSSLFDEVDPTMPRKLVSPEMRVFQGGPNKYGPDVPGTKAGLDNSKLLTGEGADVQGSGHYLAQNRGTAQLYVPNEGGHVYEYDLPDETIGKMLEWDRPLSEQSDDFQSVFRPFIEKALKKNKLSPAQYEDGIKRWMERENAGAAFTAMRKVLGEEKANRTLLDAGIPGIRYSDNNPIKGSAGASNFVLFDENAAKLMARDDVRFEGLLDPEGY